MPLSESQRHWPLEYMSARDETTKIWIEVLTADVFVTLARAEGNRLQVIAAEGARTTSIRLKFMDSVRKGEYVAVKCEPKDDVGVVLLAFPSEAMAAGFQAAAGELGAGE